MPKTSPCKWCGAPMQWAETENGRKIPLDMGVLGGQPTNAAGRPLTLFYVDDGIAKNTEGRPGFACHWDTCPEAARARAATRAKREATR